MCATVLVAGLSACGPQAAQQQFDVPNCGVTQASLYLMAQAVPSAVAIPCIKSLPTGWSFSSIDVHSGSAKFTLDSDRAGTNALQVLLTGACRPSGTRIPSDQPGGALYLKIDSLSPEYSGTRYYLFPHECVIYRFRFPKEGKAVLTTDASNAIGTIPRDALEHNLQRQGYHL